MMKPSRVVSAVAAMLRLFGWAFLLPVLVAFAYEPRDLVVLGLPAVPPTVPAFLGGLLATQAVALAASVATRKVEEEDLIEREGYLTAGIGWLLLPLFGAIPFVASGLFTSPLDAYFEAMSGITTTGFTVLPVPADAVAPSLNFWRAQLNWLGGIGIVILSIALISKLTHGGVQLFQAESSVHAAKRLRPKLADTAQVLLGVYAAFTGVLFALLLAALLASGLGWRDAVFDGLIHVMSGFATGGFSSHSASVGAFASVWVEAALVLTMVLGATNFQVLIALRRGQVRQAFANAELRFYLASLGLATAVVAAILALHGHGAAASARDGAFATASLMTTTGFSTVDWSTWPVAALLVLHALLFFGGASGSTGGALKAFRIMIMAKMVARELRRLIHPRAIIPVRFGGRVIEDAALAAVTTFMFSYLLMWIAGTVAISVLEPSADPLEAAAASAASIGNVGNAFGMFGPAADIAALGAATKGVMMALMWFGRLEIFTALLLFYPSSWRN